MTEDELAHYGVLGMKWGHRKTATGGEIRAARRRLKSQSIMYRKDYKKYDGAADGSARKALLERKLRAAHQTYLKDPDRAIASRMTRGEKAAAVFFNGPNAAGLATSLGAVVATSAVSRRIENQQDKGAYDKLSNKPVRKRIGFQTGRSVMVNGAMFASSIASSGSKMILQRAMTNRTAAAKAASVVTPKALMDAAAKINYAKAARGAYKITTLK